MSTSAFYTVTAALFSKATTALAGNARVVRGKDLTNEFGDVVMIGRQDLEAEWDQAGSVDQSRQTFGGGREELGQVNGLVLAWNGDSDQDAATAAAFVHLAALEATVRADPTLGITAFDYLIAELVSGEVTERQSDDGASTVLPFTVAYQARL